jgi:hypothetical protein
MCAECDQPHITRHFHFQYGDIFREPGHPITAILPVSAWGMLPGDTFSVHGWKYLLEVLDAEFRSYSHGEGLCVRVDCRDVEIVKV